MNKYLVTYHAPSSSFQQMASATPEQRQAGMDMWMSWAKKAGSALADMGAPLGSSVALGGTSRHDLGGFSVLQAESVDAAKALLDGHPHLHTPGGWIEVHPFMAM